MTTEDDTGGANTAEFDTMAAWTAEAALALGRDHYVPAACRGSGGPPVLDWLIEHTMPSADTRMLDVGAGVGGPSAHAAQRTGVRPVLVEPQPAACRAARRLFSDLAVVQADATALPFTRDSFDLVWSLGVLDTLPDHRRFFAETVRCLALSGTIGLLAYLAVGEVSVAPESNHFPDQREMDALIRDAGLTCTERLDVSDLGPVAAQWIARADEVDREIARRHRQHPTWIQAHDQEQRVALLLEDGQVRAELFLLRGSGRS